MVASVLSCLLRGLKGQVVEVQVDVSPGKTGFNLVGLGDVGVKEARERVRSAIRNSQLPFPQQRLTVNLAPAELRKEGSGFDLAITRLTLPRRHRRGYRSALLWSEGLTPPLCCPYNACSAFSNNPLLRDEVRSLRWAVSG
jgi:hypothetical protein